MRPHTTRPLRYWEPWPAALFVFFVACNERATTPSPTPASSTTAVSSVVVAASAQPPASVGPVPVTRDETRVPGLRVRSGTIAANTLWGFTELAVEWTHARLELAVAPRGATLDHLLPKGALAIVNGGYFEADYRPSTWVKNGKRVLSPKTDTKKGGLLAVRRERVFVGPFSELDFVPELAIQSFPLIVEPGGRPGIHRDDGRRAARTIACSAGVELHFVIIFAPRGEGPTLFETMPLLRDTPPRGFGCTVALNLDGGPSTGVVFGPTVAGRQRIPAARVGYGLAIVPRRAPRE